MKVATIFASVLFMALLLGGTSEGKSSTRRSPKELNIKEPLDALKAAYDNFKHKFNILSIIKLVLSLIPCIIQALSPSSSSLHEISSMSRMNFNLRLNDSELELLAEKIASLPFPSINFQVSEDPFCKTGAFKSLHDFVWMEEKQLADLVHFFGRFGYPGIYDVIDKFYDPCPELKDDLPKKPADSKKKSKSNNRVTGNTNVREQVLLQSRQNLRQAEPKCNILDIITTLPDTGLIELVQFYGTLTNQFNNNPSLHFLVGKLQEPVKGKSVRKFREEPAAKTLLTKAHENLKENEKWKEFFMIIKQLIGLDFFDFNPLDFMYSLVEYLVWGTPFPAEEANTSNRNF